MNRLVRPRRFGPAALLREHLEVGVRRVAAGGLPARDAGHQHRMRCAALDDRELDVLPWLMLEGLIMESVIPIANEGRFARIPGSAFLDMIARKAEWLANRAGAAGDELKARRA